MNRNYSKVAMAVCAALGSTAAMADYSTASKIYVGGATATDNTLEEALISQVGGLCNPSKAINIYRATNQKVIVCTTVTGTAGASDAEIALHKESNGGSSNGIVPITQGAAHSLVWLNPAGMTNQSCTSTNAAATTNLVAYVNHAGCSLAVVGAADGVVATGGISDVEPKLVFPSVTNATTFMTVTPVLDILFGVPVTKNLYQALKAAQFSDAIKYDNTACDSNPTTGAYVLNTVDLAGCVPSLSRAQIGALYSGAITNWNTLVGRADGSTLVSLAPSAPADTAPRICRRPASSGTQAGAEAYFLGQRCVATGQVFATPDDDSTETDTVNAPLDFAGGTTVHVAVGSGDIRSCLQAAQTGNFWGIGVLSTEVTASNLSGAGDSFRFVGIDGYAPTVANVANGNYTYFTSNVITKANTATGVPGAVMSVLPTLLGNPFVIANLNATFAGRPWGNGGILAKLGTTTTNTAPYSDAELTASPVNSLTKSGNNCVPAWARSKTPTL